MHFCFGPYIKGAKSLNFWAQTGSKATLTMLGYDQAKESQTIPNSICELLEYDFTLFVGGAKSTIFWLGDLWRWFFG